MLVQSVGADVQNLDEHFLGVFRSADMEGLLFGFGFVLLGFSISANQVQNQNTALERHMDLLRASESKRPY